VELSVKIFYFLHQSTIRVQLLGAEFRVEPSVRLPAINFVVGGGWGREEGGIHPASGHNQRCLQRARGARLLVELCVKVARHHPGGAGLILHQRTIKTLAECNHSEPWLTVELSVKVSYYFASGRWLLGARLTSGT